MSRTGCQCRWLTLFTAVVCLSPSPSRAQESQPFDRTPEDCISVGSIERTRALDDRTILFYMRNNRAYRNYLPRDCPGLEQQNRFMYETRGGRLCSIDTITVLEQWVSRIERGFTCRLGEFHPLSPEDIEDIEELEELEKRGRRGRDAPGPGAIETEPVELPDDAREADEPRSTAEGGY